MCHRLFDDDVCRWLNDIAPPTFQWIFQQNKNSCDQRNKVRNQQRGFHFYFPFCLLVTPSLRRRVFTIGERL